MTTTGYDNADSRFEAALLALDHIQARKLLYEQETDLSPMLRVERIIIPALERIGTKWEQGLLALSQVYMSGRICEELVDSILPKGQGSRKEQPKIAIAVLEDYHLLGKRLVYSAMRASGYILLDFGRQDVNSLVQRTLEEKIEVLLISTLMLPSALRVADVRRELTDKGSNTRIIVGGAPFRFDSELWREVGADAMGTSASEAPTLVASVAGGLS